MNHWLPLLLICLSLASLIGCGPNTPEPAPPPPVAAGETVMKTSLDPASTPVASAADPAQSPPAQKSVTELIAALNIEADRQSSAVALAAKGKAAVPALIKALDHAEWQVRAAAVFALSQMGNQAADAKTRLQKIAEQDENPSVRDAAAFALDGIEGK